MTPVTDQLLTFNAELHEYRIGKRKVPSVTQLLSSAGMVNLPPPSDPRVIRKRIIGKQVHLACQYIDEGGLNWDTLDPVCLGYVQAYSNFKQATSFVPWLIEHRFSAIVGGDKRCNHQFDDTGRCLICGGLRYGGTLDRTGLVNGYPNLLDIKTVVAAQAHWGLQTAGYSMGIQPPTVRPYFWPRSALQLFPNGKYRLVPFADPVDFDVFTAMLQSLNHPAVLRWKANHHIAVEEDY